ncbi:MAG: hypothetical protein GY865_01275 [candidate division Zixibacteria bacterium]|nr:hypothetical protein [candidate division Zixibacteria bacterium]
MNKKLLRIYMYLFLVSILTIGGSIAEDIKVTYISSEATYIDGGIDDGLSFGDSLNVYRNDSLQAVLEVINIASSSSACAIINQTGDLITGDIVSIIGIHQPDKSKLLIIDENLALNETKGKPKTSNVDGYLSIQNYWQHDMTGSSLSYTQPSLVSRINIENILGPNIKLSLRHRSRKIFRNRELGSSINSDQWSHRVYQIALSNNRQNSWHWRFGRQSITELSGIGLVDGLLVSHQFSDKIKAGFAVGFEPELETTDISFERRKVGFFADWQNNREIHNLRFKLGLTGSYYKMEVNREFLTLITNYRYKRTLSFSKFLEIDINRSWRKGQNNNIFDISSLYLNVRYQVTTYLALNTSYDRRAHYRIFETRNVPDTLFDNSLHQGFRAGYNLKINKNTRLSGYGGIRFREDIMENNIVASSSLSLRHFPSVSHSLLFSFTYVKSQFTTGYRSSIRYNLPASRKFRLSVVNTFYNYSGLSLSTNYYYLDLIGNYSISRRYYISGSYRQNFDKENLSGQMFLQLGINL